MRRKEQVEPYRVSQMHDMNLLIKLASGLALANGRLQATNYAYVYEQRFSERTGTELKPRPLWGPLGVPGKPQASKADLLRQIAQALDDNPKEIDA